MTPEEQYGVIKAPDSPLMAKAAEMFRGVERRVAGSPAEFLIPGGGIAQVLERKAYGEDPSAFEYGMAGLDVIDIVPGAGTAVGTGGQVLLGAVLAGPKAIGKVGDRIREATELFGKKRDEIIKNETGVIRTLENQPGFAIPSMGEGGTKLKEDAANEVTRAFQNRDSASKASDYIDWPLLYEAYPQAANIPVEIIDTSTFPREIGVIRPYYNPDTQSIYMPARISPDNQNASPYLKDDDVQRGMTKALAEFVDATEGRLTSKGLDTIAVKATPEAKALKEAELKRVKLQETGPVSPQKQFELSQQRYPGEIQDATTSNVYTMRSDAIDRGYSGFGSQITDKDTIQEQIENLERAYGDTPRRRYDRNALGTIAGSGQTYPLELGSKLGNLPSLYSYETGTFQSPLLSKVGSLKQEKGSGDQFLGALKKTNPNPEDLEYSGLENYLRGRKNVTKDEVLEYLTERAIPLERKDTTFFNNAYVVQPFSGTKFKKGSEHSNPQTLEIITRTDPISGVPALPRPMHSNLSTNAIAWARHNERIVENPATGESFDALFVDEIQSDWHQKGKKVADIKHAQVAEDTYPKMASEVKEEGREKLRNGDFAGDNPDKDRILWEKNEMRKRTPELREQALKDAYDPNEGGVPDAPFKKNWHELTLREVFREAIAKGHDGVALSTNAMQSRKYGGKKFNFYDGPLRNYMSKFAKRYGSKVERYELPQIQIDDVPGNFLGTRKAVKAGEQTKGQEVFYMPITDEMREWAKTPVSTYARGGGVQSLAPIAKNMYRGYDDVKRGVGSYMPHTRYSRRP